MSTLKTNNIEHLDASTPSIQTTIGGGTILAGVSTVSGTLNVGSGTSISSPATNTLTLGTNDVERLRISSDGDLSIGGTPPWTVTGSGYRNLSLAGSTAASSGFVWLGNGGATTNDGFDLTRINVMNGPTIVSQIKGSTGDGNNDSGKITFTTKATGSSLAEAATFTTAGNLAFPSGQGIDFSATADGTGTATSELLDDYEEGTWTPVASAVAGGGTWTTAENYDAQYTKVGNLVNVNLFFSQIYYTGTPLGYLEIAGLPFAKKTNSFTQGACVATNISFGADSYLVVEPTNTTVATTKCYIKVVTNNSGGSDLQANAFFNTAATLRFSLTYQT